MTQGENRNHYEYLNTNLGIWKVEANDIGVTRISFIESIPDSDQSNPSEITQNAASQLNNYFKGTLRRFDLPLDWSSGTPFQKQVWKEVSYIEYGDTASYMKIAKEIGNPDAVRAVGAANGANPIPIIVPCHRIIGSDGSLTGYASGLELKKNLLKLEGAIPKTLFD